MSKEPQPPRIDPQVAVCFLQIMLQGMHHVAVITADYGRAKHFYTHVLGMEVISEAYRAERQSWKLDLRVGPADTTQIELFSFPNPPPRVSRPEACGARHLCFRVIDIEGAVQRLQAAGVVCEPVRVDEYTGERFVFFADPDGLPIELKA